MKVSTKGRYALRMMIDIAENSAGNTRVPIKDISERQGISVKYLEQIVAQLTRAGLLRSVRGMGGGYSLAKSPEQYTAGEILRSLEGRLTPVACLEEDVSRCEQVDVCRTHDFWEGLYKVIDDYVNGATLKDLMKESEQAIDKPLG